MKYIIIASFNPAEAEEGFSSVNVNTTESWLTAVSIQPKPKKGLVAALQWDLKANKPCFNPAEAEEGFSSLI